MGSKYKHVFTPMTIRGVEFKNRVQASPSVAGLFSDEGCMTFDAIKYYRAYARGGAGTVTVGNASIDLAESRDESTNQIDLSTDKVILGLNSYVEDMARYGCVANIEINHAGRNAPFENTGRIPFGPSPITPSAELDNARRSGREPVKVIEMDTLKIQEMIQKFADAALRCKKAGFKMIMLHGAHGNLISQFVSPFSNKRTDKYGGSLENRARFAIEVIDAVRKVTGENMVIEYRISADEIIEGGMHLKDTIEFCKLIEDKIDLLHVSAGLREEMSTAAYMIQPTYMEHMQNVKYTREMKKHLKVPIVVVGSIMNLGNAEKIISNGEADFAAMLRPFMADPDLVRKCAKDQPEDVRPCLRCKYHARIIFNRILGCAVNPMCSREFEFPEGRVPKAAKKKKVAVVGGGPAGIQAALTAVERGHDVTLYEKNDYLGGNMIPAAAPDFKGDLKAYKDWALRQIEKCGARIRLKTEVTSKLLEREKPEAVILAVGADPIIPDLLGINKPNVHLAADADMGKIKIGKSVIIIGAGQVGIESAIALGKQGKDVTLIEIQDQCMKGESGLAATALIKMAQETGVKILTCMKLDEVTDKGVRCTDIVAMKTTEFACDSVLLALGLRSRKDTVAALRHAIPETEIYIVGDAIEPQDIGTAVNTAFSAAVAI
jgi:2,4-dienoyl-CoA reductase-like NADH-dependent reductase (Old Yellow Enzyme family)/thioredoxin reductase